MNLSNSPCVITIETAEGTYTLNCTQATLEIKTEPQDVDLSELLDAPLICYSWDIPYEIEITARPDLHEGYDFATFKRENYDEKG